MTLLAEVAPVASLTGALPLAILIAGGVTTIVALAAAALGVRRTGRLASFPAVTTIAVTIVLAAGALVVGGSLARGADARADTLDAPRGASGLLGHPLDGYQLPTLSLDD